MDGHVFVAINLVLDCKSVVTRVLRVNVYSVHVVDSRKGRVLAKG